MRKSQVMGEGTETKGDWVPPKTEIWNEVSQRKRSQGLGGSGCPG